MQSINTQYIDAYLSQVYYIDGLALGPGYFGFTDPLTNTWRPRKFRAEGTTVNDGTTWSTTWYFLKTISGFDGLFNTANDAYLSSPTGTIIDLDLSLSKIVYCIIMILIKVEISSPLDISFNGHGTSSTAYRWTDIDLMDFHYH